jgi:zinc protease
MRFFLSRHLQGGRLFLLLLVPTLVGACQPAPPSDPAAFTVDYESYTLENGLDVVLHIDRSDPIVAVAVTYHVGSARERPGKTGFAHLFEHLQFLNSEHLGPGGIDALVDKVGGTMNGSTNRDRTNYYQVVPRDALEKALWAEADRMGYFINTVTGEVVEKETQVVKNEKRQSYDNRPGGHTYFVIDRNLYPPEHPYHWQVIGSLADLDTASLDDVREFYDTWYGPDAATLVVSGDFDPEEARLWIERHFGGIDAGSTPSRTREITPVELHETKRRFHEDKLAHVPTLTMSWPTVRTYHADAYPLELLAALLAESKASPLYAVVVDEEMLAPSVDAYTEGGELAGKFNIWIQGFERVDLNRVDRAIRSALIRFEQTGFTEADLDRVKAVRETAFYDGYNSISSILGKAFALAEYNIFAGSPGYLSEDIRRVLSVTADDVVRVYERYIRDRHFVATSFVPAGEADLALADSVRAEIVEEPIITGREAELAAPPTRSVAQTPSAFDRSVEPPFGPAPSLTVPDIWTSTLENGVAVYGIEHTEVPVVRFTIRLRGGLLLDDPLKVGVAHLVAQMMTEGTAGRTPEELEQAIDALGSSISVAAGRESLTLSGSTLRRHYDRTMALVEEILLEPRWDEDEFPRIRKRTISQLRQQSADPTAIATNTFNLLIYGTDHILSHNVLGTIASVESIAIDDLRDYYQRYVSPSVANIHVVGDVSQDEATASLAGLGARWTPVEVDAPRYELPAGDRGGRIYFVDVPGASQSVIRVGAMALAETDPDFFPASVMNVRLGGVFVSRLNQVLREQKGYTYGASSRFSGSDRPGPFSVGTGVRSNVTLESVELIRDILAGYADGFTPEDLAATQSYLIRSNARAFETLRAKIGMLEKISTLRFPLDYVAERERVVGRMTLARVRDLARRHVDPARMIFLVVGDARTQLPRLLAADLGQPILIDGP